MAYQLELRYAELARDEETAIVGAPGGTRQTGDAGTSGTAREMASLQSQLDASVTVDAALYTTYDQLEAGIIQAHKACYDAGGNPSYMIVDSQNASYLPEFVRSTARQRDIGNSTELYHVIDLYASQFGQLDVVLDRFCDDAVLLLDFNYLATPVLRPTTDWELARTGDSINRQILRESTFAVLNDKSCAMVDSVPTNLAAV